MALSFRSGRASTRRRRLELERLENRVLLSHRPVLVKDINTAELSSNPSQFIALGNLTYFTADDGVHGIQLWRTDGTAAGTVRITDINPDNPQLGFDPRFLTNVNGTLFFVGIDPVLGEQLWKSDGTAKGTVIVKDINPGNGSYPLDLTNVNGKLFFIAFDGVQDNLWESDATAAGTVMVSTVANPKYLTNVDGRLFFVASDGTSERLWTSDGTAAGTVEITPTSASIYYPTYLTSANGRLFFSAFDFTPAGTSHGVELWESDGTNAGTVLVKDINPQTNGNYGLGSYPSHLTNVNGTLFFTANDGVDGKQLWKSDGTEAGTVLVKIINPAPSGTYFTFLENVDGTLFFGADDGVHGRELWKSDGTSAGTVVVKDINPGTLTDANGTLFFSANDGVHGDELWKTDGTDAGTVMVRDINPGPASSNPGAYPGGIAYVNGILFFNASDGVHGQQLWKSDGTAAGTVLIKRINRDTANSYPRDLTNVDGTLFFSAFDPLHGDELWKSDGTAAGTRLVKDINPGPYGSVPENLTNVDGELFFTAFLNGTPSLFKSNGTSQGTVLVYSPGIPISELVAVRDELYFVVGELPGSGAAQLWKTDGTPAGTVPVTNANEFVSITNLTAIDGTLYFAGNVLGEGTEPWTSDGTATGTVLLKDINPGSPSSRPQYFTEVGGTVFFQADDGVHGPQLWKTDGTTAGTVMVNDINSSGFFLAIYPNQLTSFHGALYFDEDGQLWRSDGTAAGTVMIKAVAPSDLTRIGDQLFFQGNDGSNATELWRSDGTTAGTTLVKVIGPENGGPIFPIIGVGGTAYFTASDGVHGKELWQSDGTSAGTFMVADLYPGLQGSYPKYLTNVDGTLFFAANDQVHGDELFKLAAGSDDSGGDSQDSIFQPQGVVRPHRQQASDSGGAAAILFQNALAQRAADLSTLARVRPQAADRARAGIPSAEPLLGNRPSGEVHSFLASVSQVQRPDSGAWPNRMLVDALFRALGEL